MDEWAALVAIVAAMVGIPVTAREITATPRLERMSKALGEAIALVGKDTQQGRVLSTVAEDVNLRLAARHVLPPLLFPWVLVPVLLVLAFQLEPMAKSLPGNEDIPPFLLITLPWICFLGAVFVAAYLAINTRLRRLLRNRMVDDAAQQRGAPMYEVFKRVEPNFWLGHFGPPQYRRRRPPSSWKQWKPSIPENKPSD